MVQVAEHSTRGSSWARKAFEPIDIASLVFFRIVFGLLLMIEALGLALIHYQQQVRLPKEFHFKYFGFEWIQAPPGNWIYLLYGVLFFSSLSITAGIFYRVGAIIFAICFAWVFFIDATDYLNHFYLIMLIGFFLVFLPLNRRFALDSMFNPKLRSDVVPAWTLWVINLQTAIVYFYGGLAKLNEDWLHGEPVRTWLRDRFMQTPWLPLAESEWTIGVIAYGGLLFDLLIVPAILWRRTRVAAFLTAVGFHLTNNWLFDIGIFPWMGIGLTALFFTPSWPRDLLKRVSRLRHPITTGPAAKPLFNLNQVCFRHQRAIISLLCAYFAWQVATPLRHFLYPGNVSWTEEGHFYAWHMKLRSKTGNTQFYLVNAHSGEVWSIDPLAYLTPRQVYKMNGHPDFIHQFAQHVGKLMAEKGHTNARVQVYAHAELNSRHSSLLIDPTVNLAAIPRILGPADWILPIDNKQELPANFLAVAGPTANAQAEN